MTDSVEAAWAELHDATPPGWYVGRPSYHDERDEWVMYVAGGNTTGAVDSAELYDPGSPPSASGTTVTPSPSASPASSAGPPTP